ncbi:MAG: hypothetical protein ACRDTD_00395, partial [Pseudonocardiaceae bacterium]
MTTASGRALARCAAVLLFAVLGGWLVATGIGLHRADGAENSSRPESTISPSSRPSGPTLTLIPNEGKPGTLFTVKGSGYSTCDDDCTSTSDGQFPRVEVSWDTNEVLATAAMGDDGTFSAAVKVPQIAAPGNHQIVGKFGTESAEATFVVRPPPILTLYPAEGPPGSLFEVEGEEYSPCISDVCPPVEVLWGANNEKIGTGVMGSDGRFSVDVNVPETATPGNYQVVGKFGTESAEAIFAVFPPPTLTLSPNEGPTGTLFNVKGSGYGHCFGTCAYISQSPQVEVIWDTNEVLTTAAMNSDGAFLVENVRVPQTATPGNHRVIGKFGAESASAIFAVEPSRVDPAVLHLTLIPNEGHSGDFFKIEGRGYNKCLDRGNRVVNIYDQNVPDSNGFSLALARNVPISG